MSRTKQNQQAQPSSSPVRPEAELESRLVAALSTAFPNIPREQLVEQRRFTVRLGHEIHEFDSAAQWEKSGRADVILFHDGRPLAVVELKREDLALTHADYEQAQSYANQLTPRPPLVVVTNGRDTRIYDANTGQLWSGEQDAANAVARLLANAAKLAAADMRWATEALMGRETGVWVPIVRSTTARLLTHPASPIAPSPSFCCFLVSAPSPQSNQRKPGRPSRSSKVQHRAARAVVCANLPCARWTVRIWPS